jgi:ABC-type nickel/cobalt efflux system permease component RcnA
MGSHSPMLLVLAVAAVGVLHTLVPDHWAPISLLAREHGWTRSQTARAAAMAGAGHAISTLAIAALVWFAGAMLAARFGHAVSVASSIALVVFGLWIAIGSWRELHGQKHDHAHLGHSHVHRHPDGTEHRHWHEHHEADWHAIDGTLALAPLHDHEHRTSPRTALLLILGSSPMVEGIPAFFAASRYGLGLLAVMSVVFAASTIATYVALCVASAAGMQRLNIGPLERYGEVLSGSLIAVLGAVFLFIPTP